MTEIQNESIQTAYDLLLSGNLPEASHVLERIMIQDLENPEIDFFLKCLGFWKGKVDRLEILSTPQEKGAEIFKAWINFCNWEQHLPNTNSKCINAFKEFAFSKALRFYQETLENQKNSDDTEVYRRIGLCLKILGNFEQAERYLSYASQKSPNNATLTADLADCYAFLGETRMSKVLFREAFFINAQAVELEWIESESIKLLVQKIKEAGYEGLEILEWIPVYGVLFGVFNVKRELRAVEIGKLKQACYSMENQMEKASAEEQKLLIPRLINHYFWLIDHYLNVRDDRAKMDEILLKIKILNPSVYEKYNS